jgi:predicted SAM-dependent methyltransferase
MKYIYMLQRTNNSLRRRLKSVLILLDRRPKKHIKKEGSLKLNIGCGKVKYPGWINIDVDSNADLVIDVRSGLPFEENSVDFVYSEHFFEHLTFEESEKVLSYCHKCLKKGSTIRIATPDLDYLIKKYAEDWKNQDWLGLPEYEFIKTKGRMINIAFRDWGHKFLFNEEDLRNHLWIAGFKDITRCSWGNSSHKELSELETRKDSKLIMEAVK